MASDLQNWQRSWDRQNPQIAANETLLNWTANQKDTDRKALVGLLPEAANIVDTIQAKDDEIAEAERFMKEFEDIMVGAENVTPILGAADDEDQLLNQEDKYDSEAMSNMIGEGTSYELASKARRNLGVRDKKIKDLDVWRKMQNYKNYTDILNNPEKVWENPITNERFQLNSSATSAQWEEARRQQNLRFLRQFKGVSITTMIPYLMPIAKNQIAWKENIQTKVNFNQGEVDFQNDLSLFYQNNNFSQLLYNTHLKVDETGIPLGWGRAMDLVNDKLTVGAYKSLPKTKDGWRQANAHFRRVNNIGNIIIPEGYKGANKSYLDEYPNRINNLIRQNNQSYNEYTKEYFKNRKIEGDRYGENAVNSFDQWLKDNPNASAEEKSVILNELIEEGDRNYGNDWNHSRLDVYVEQIENPSSKEIDYHTSILETAEINGSLNRSHYEHARKLDPANISYWEKRIKWSTERAGGDRYKTYHDSSLKLLFKQDTLGKLSEPYDPPILADVQKKYRQFYKDRIDSLPQNATQENYNRAADEAYSDTITYWKSQRNANGRYYAAESADPDNNIQVGQYINFRKLREQDVHQTAYDKENNALTQFEIDLLTNLKRTPKELSTVLRNLIPKERASKLAENYKLGKEDPYIKRASKTLGRSPERIINELLKAYDLPELETKGPETKPELYFHKFPSLNTLSRFESHLVSKNPENINKFIPGGWDEYVNHKFPKPNDPKKNITVAIMKYTELFGNPLKPQNLDQDLGDLEEVLKIMETEDGLTNILAALPDKIKWECGLLKYVPTRSQLIDQSRIT